MGLAGRDMKVSQDLFGTRPHLGFDALIGGLHIRNVLLVMRHRHGINDLALGSSPHHRPSLTRMP